MEPDVTKHAQSGTSWEDHSVLPHSGYGPYCNENCRHAFPQALPSLQYFMKVDNGSHNGSPVEWYAARAEALRHYIHLLENESPLAGICVACSYSAYRWCYAFNSMPYMPKEAVVLVR